MPAFDFIHFSQPSPKVKHILVPLDFTKTSAQLLPYAAVLARHFGCTVTLLHVVHLNIVGEERGVPLARFVEEMKRAVERVLQQMVASSSFPTARVVARVGEPASAILLETAESHADLIILGRPQRSGLAHLLGPSVSKRIIRRAPCPVIVVP